MKTGKTLNELAQELTRQREASRDFLAPTSKLSVNTNPQGGTELFLPETGFFPVTDHTHGQVSTWSKIPKVYYDRMRTSAPALFDKNLNHWFSESSDRRMIRTLDGNARAFLSDRYRPFDNYKVAENALGAIQNANCIVQSCEVTERRFYLKVVSPKVSHDLGLGDIVQAGLVISNSEIGAGSLMVEPLIYRLACLNGMISADTSFRRNHVGSVLGRGEKDGAIEFFTDETRQKSDEVVFMQIRDIVAGTLTDQGFKAIVEKFKAAKEQKLPGDAFEVVTELTKKEGLNEWESKGILTSLLTSGDNTLFGLVNAVTDFSKHVESYDRATEFERLGGKILEAELVA